MLTDLYLCTPRRVLRWICRLLGIRQENAHDWLCGPLTCRCDIW